MPQTLYLSTSDFENAVDTLLTAANCFERQIDAEETAAKHGEHVFPITVGDRIDR